MNCSFRYAACIALAWSPSFLISSSFSASCMPLVVALLIKLGIVGCWVVHLIVGDPLPRWVLSPSFSTPAPSMIPSSTIFAHVVHNSLTSPLSRCLDNWASFCWRCPSIAFWNLALLSLGSSYFYFPLSCIVMMLVAVLVRNLLPLNLNVTSTLACAANVPSWYVLTFEMYLASAGCTNM